MYSHKIYPDNAHKKNSKDFTQEMPFGVDFQFKHYFNEKFYIGADVDLGLHIGYLVDGDIEPVYSAGISFGYTY